MKGPFPFSPEVCVVEVIDDEIPLVVPIMVIMLRECRMGDFHYHFESIHLPNEMLELACMMYFMVHGRVEECTNPSHLRYVVTRRENKTSI